MKDLMIEELVLKYLEGNRTQKQKEEIKTRLKELGYDIRDLDNLITLNDQLDKIPSAKPSLAMTDKFYEMLNDYKLQNHKNKNPLGLFFGWLKSHNYQKGVFRFAYSIIILFVGWAIGFWISPNPRVDTQLEFMVSEIKELKTMMSITMLNQPSPTERIKAINALQSINHGDGRVVNALLTTLNTDKNVNVRLFALDVLVQKADNPQVRQGLINSIGRQDSPLMQLALADAMITLREKEAIGQFKLLLQKKELNYSVREKISKSLKILT